MTGSEVETPKPPDEASTSTSTSTNAQAPEPKDDTQSVPMEIEYDDFGLPIRRGSPVKYCEGEEEDHGAGSVDRAADEANGTTHQEEAERKAVTDTVKESSGEEAGKEASEGSSAEDDFEDAVATPPQVDLATPAESESQAGPTADQDEDGPSAGAHSESSDEKASMQSEDNSAEKDAESAREENHSISAEEETEKHAVGDQGLQATQEASATNNDTTKEEEVTLEDKANEAQATEPALPVSKRDSVQQPVIAVNSISEFSHQQVSMPAKQHDEDDDGGWQTMPAFAPYDMYDDDNRLIAKEYNEELEEDKTYSYAGMGGAGKGYTRVLVDDDAESVTSMDDNTNYLFKNAAGTSIVDDEDTRDAVAQMQATKDLLTEGQKIAYVGLTRIEMSQMVKEMESLQRSRSTKKAVQLATEALKMWCQKIMIRIYTHMDISTAEQVMIEQLSEHGVISSDLTPQLMANARVKNPMADRKSSVSSSRPMSVASPKPTSSGFSSPRPGSPRNFGEETPAEPPPAYDKHEGEELPAVRLPDQLPGSAKLDIDIRWTILCDLFLVLIADSIYDSRSRVLFERVGKALEIDWIDICRFERRVTEALEMQQQAEQENWNEDEHMESRRKLALKKRYIVMGLATVGGGLVIGLSAGLLAPVIGAGLAAGFTTIGVTGTTSFLGGAAASAIITSGAAASGSVIGARAANRRTGAVKTFEYRPLHNNKRVNLIVTISGWMTGKVDDVRLPFSTVDPVMGDIYSVLWEPEMLTSMGDTINILATEVSFPFGNSQVPTTNVFLGSHTRPPTSAWKHHPCELDGSSAVACRIDQALIPDRQSMVCIA